MTTTCLRICNVCQLRLEPTLVLEVGTSRSYLRRESMADVLALSLEEAKCRQWVEKSCKWLHELRETVESRVVAVGKVLRDQHGEWILEYNRHSGKCSVFDAELWGILDDLTLLQNPHCDRVSIQTDSMEAIWAIQKSFFKTNVSAFDECRPIDART
ncbi:hypothetical protein Goarm_018246, partial [Gossypium armourianum]|nr:hypothetical protein [Gossypium armourianum]